jgi:energy-coupling factor transporter ATPase
VVDDRSNPLIRIRNLHFEYQSGPVRIGALRGVDLDIREGEYLALAGANGSGKSTLLMHLNALLLPTSGDVTVSGWNTKDPSSLRSIRNTVGMVFQSPDSQIIGTVVEEDVAFGPENIGVPERELPLRVTEALRVMGLLELRKRPSRLLSSGQKQLLVVASALSMHPRCLVLDEATSMLDPASRTRLLERVELLNRRGMTLISATHAMDEAVRAKRVVVLSEGRIAADAAPASVFADGKMLRRTLLEAPSSVRLARKIAGRLAGFTLLPLSMQELADGVARYLGKGKREGA